jgi:hypothetical protein
MIGDPFLNYFALGILIFVVMSGYQIPLGAAAVVAIYTEHWHHLSVMRKILLRMQSWRNYIYLEGH